MRFPCCKNAFCHLRVLCCFCSQAFPSWSFYCVCRCRRCGKHSHLSGTRMCERSCCFTDERIRSQAFLVMMPASRICSIDWRVWQQHFGVLMHELDISLLLCHQSVCIALCGVFVAMQPPSARRRDCCWLYHAAVACLCCISLCRWLAGATNNDSAATSVRRLWGSPLLPVVSEVRPRRGSAACAELCVWLVKVTPSVV